MMVIEFILLPVVGSLIGWFTNVVAVKMLFRPHIPIKIPGTPWQLQGLIPRRQNELAKKIGEVIEEQLLSQDDLIKRLGDEALRQFLMTSFSEIIISRLRDKLPPIIPSTFRQILLDIASDLLKKEFPKVFDSMLERMSRSLKDHVPISGMVEERVRGYDLEELENMVFKVAATELKHIEWLGGLLGFIIGLLQALLLWLIRHVLAS